MSDTTIAALLRQTGARLIDADGQHDSALIPLQQDGVVFQQMFEYAVADFEAEVGFYASVFGFPTIALTSDYALFKHPEAGYCMSFRKDESLLAATTIGLKLLFMTADIPAAEAHLEEIGLVPDRETRKGSPVQDVIHFSTPAGLAVEIWEDPAPGMHEAQDNS